VIADNVRLKSDESAVKLNDGCGSNLEMNREGELYRNV
jgi:hypothetical protein